MGQKSYDEGFGIGVLAVFLHDGGVCPGISRLLSFPFRFQCDLCELLKWIGDHEWEYMRCRRTGDCDDDPATSAFSPNPHL